MKIEIWIENKQAQYIRLLQYVASFQVLREKLVTSIIPCYFDFVEKEINRPVSYVPVTG